MGWLDAWSSAREGEAARLYAGFAEQETVATDASAYLPPLDPRQVFAALEPTEELVVLGDALRADSTRRYVHQVLRAIHGLGVRRERPGFALAWLGELTRNPNPTVQLAALLAYTLFRPAEIPDRALLILVDDGEEEPAARRAALLALSHGADHRVYPALVRTALVADHPARDTALGRLGDLDDGFLLEVLDGPEDADAPDLARIRARSQGADGAYLAGRVQAMLERAAWVDLTGERLADRFVPWTLARLMKLAALAEVRAQLDELRTGYVPDPIVAAGLPFEDVQARVRGYAAQVIAAVD